MEVNDELQALAFSPGKEIRYSLYSRLGGPQSLSLLFWIRRNVLSLLEFEPRTVQSVVDNINIYKFLTTVTITNNMAFFEIQINVTRNSAS
jgi:hypothetical protein